MGRVRNLELKINEITARLEGLMRRNSVLAKRASREDEGGGESLNCLICNLRNTFQAVVIFVQTNKFLVTAIVLINVFCLDK